MINRSSLLLSTLELFFYFNDSATQIDQTCNFPTFVSDVNTFGLRTIKRRLQVEKGVIHKGCPQMREAGLTYTFNEVYLGQGGGVKYGQNFADVLYGWSLKRLEITNYILKV